MADPPLACFRANLSMIKATLGIANTSIAKNCADHEAVRNVAAVQQCERVV
jgi:hypothetical protein